MKVAQHIVTHGIAFIAGIGFGLLLVWAVLWKAF